MGDLGTILTSVYGMTWTPRSSGTSNYLIGITYGNNTFVVVGIYGIILQTGPLNVDPTIPIVSTFTLPASSTTLTVAITAFAATDDVGVTGYMVTESSTKPSALDSGWSMTPPTGYTFASAGAKTLYAWVKDGDGNVSLSGSASVNILPTADPLNNWHSRNTLPTGNQFSGITYGNNTFVAVSYDWRGPGAIVTSPDGSSWSLALAATTNGLIGVTYGNKAFVVVGTGGTILTSPDGINWASRNSGTTNDLYEVAYSNNTFVAVGVRGTILISPDGTNWTSRPSGTQNWLWAVTYGNNTFVAVGNGGTIIQSDPVVSITNPDISISPASVNFGYVSVGSISSAQTFTVSNNGDSDLLVGSITLTAATFDFTKENDHCSGQTIPPSGICTLEILFSPVSSGTKSANLSIPSNHPVVSPNLC